jgi:hypothetical protein
LIEPPRFSIASESTLRRFHGREGRILIGGVDAADRGKLLATEQRAGRRSPAVSASG